jgi:F-type H+-transporting ATPase subunit delta
VINNTLARRYAKALVQIGSEDGLIDRFRDELTAIERIFSANADLKAVFANPAFTAEQKKEIMKDLVATAKCSELVGNFLLLLVDKNRVAFLDPTRRWLMSNPESSGRSSRPHLRWTPAR